MKLRGTGVSKRKHGLTDTLGDRRVGFYRGRLPLPPADVDEPRTHLVSQLPVGVVDAFEVLLTATNRVQQRDRGGGADGWPQPEPVSSNRPSKVQQDITSFCRPAGDTLAQHPFAL